MLKIINDPGSVLIGDDYYNLGVTSHGTQTMQPSNGSPRGNIQIGRVELAVSGESPILAISSTALIGLDARKRGTGSTWTFSLVSDTSNATFKYWIFDRPNLAGIGNFRLRDVAGKMVFDSNTRYMRVVDIIPYTVGGASTQPKSYTAGRTYAFCFVNTARVTTIGGGGVVGGRRRYMFTYSVSAAAMDAGGGRYGSMVPYNYTFSGGLSQPTGTWGTNAAAILVLDVTDFP